jgi:hypothetical protein
MSLYVPNVGEKESLKAILAMNAVQLILYGNLVIPDGNTTIDTLTELLTGAGRGYAPMELAPVVVEDVLTAAKWFLSLNANGKAQAQYNDVALQWTMTAVDVADVHTVQGAAGYCWVLPFKTGAKEIRVGDIVKGAAGATGIVTGVMLQSGSWGGTAVGYLNIMTKTGTFVADEVITVKGAIATVDVIAGGTGYAVGDIVTITQAGGSRAKIVVLTVNAGVVLTVGVIDGGQGYALADALPTTHLTGSGNDGLTLDIETLATTTYANVVGGDAQKRLLFLEPIATPTLVNTVGQPFTCTPIVTMSTAA